MADRLVLMGYRDNGNQGGVVSLDVSTLINLPPQGNINVLFDSVGSDANYYYSGSYDHQTRIYRNVKWTSALDLIPLNYGSQYIRRCVADGLDNYVYTVGGVYLVKYNKADLTVNAFTAHGKDYKDMAMDSTYLYIVDNYYGYIDRRLRSDLSFVDRFNVASLPGGYYYPSKIRVGLSNIYFICSGSPTGGIFSLDKSTFAVVGFIPTNVYAFTGIEVSFDEQYLYTAEPSGTGYTHYIHKLTNDPGLFYPDVIAPILTNTSWGNGLYFNGLLYEAGPVVPPDPPSVVSATAGVHKNTIIWTP